MVMPGSNWLQPCLAVLPSEFGISDSLESLELDEIGHSLHIF